MRGRRRPRRRAGAAAAAGGRRQRAVLMDLLHGPFVYLGIAAAAAIEGEVAYAAAATLVAHGALSPFGVIAAGTVGAPGGERLYFFRACGLRPGALSRG